MIGMSFTSRIVLFFTYSHQNRFGLDETMLHSVHFEEFNEKMKHLKEFERD